MDKKTRKPKNWIEAIDMTIELHKKAIEMDKDYYTIKTRYNNGHCPLCDYDRTIRERDKVSPCSQCLWIKYTGFTCSEDNGYNYTDDRESIRRLEKWREKELEEMNNGK